MKRFAVILLTIIMLFSVVACNNNNGGDKGTSPSVTGSTGGDNTPNSDNQGSTTSSGNQNQTTSSVIPYEPMPAAPKADFATDKVIYLAGDSTVKTYQENQYIGGWGQFLHLFLKNDTVVENKSEGGRSSRSFINEGRLTTNEEMSKKSYQSIESTIKAGDYLLIQFGHNDDASGGLYGDNYIERNVPLGEADENGVFPTVIPTAKVPTELPTDYVEYKTNQITQSNSYIADEQQRKEKIETELKKVFDKNLNTIKKYGSEYYSFDCGGTFKGYLKMYIDFARAKGAIPVLCTPVARVKFDNNGKIVGGPNKHGENFAYVQAVRQLAEEEKCLLIDTFEFTKNLLETVTKDYANYLMALKDYKTLFGKWPFDYDGQLDATGSDKKWKDIEQTHYNKFGAYVTAAYIAETLNTFVTENKTMENGETITFGADISLTPSFIVDCPSHLEAKLNDIKSLFKNVKITK